VPAAGIVVTTADRLWVISGGTMVVTQVDPDTNTVTQRVTLPHPVGYGTVAHGTLWVVSELDNAVIELDAESGTIGRTLERSPAMPLDDPVGIAVTGRDLWVLNHHDATLLRIDERSGTLLHTTHVRGGAPAGPFLVGDALWVAETAQGNLYRVDTATGKIVGDPVHVPAGLCAWESVVGRHVWATSVPFGDFACTNGTSRFDATTGEVTPLTSAEGRSLYTFAGYAGRLWATDTHDTLYQVDEPTGTLRPVMTFDRDDANHLFSAFGALWMTRSGAGRLLRLQSS
jgi:DNA-binding beta-propeller fold protein YncE